MKIRMLFITLVCSLMLIGCGANNTDISGAPSIVEADVQLNPAYIISNANVGEPASYDISHPNISADFAPRKILENAGPRANIAAARPAVVTVFTPAQIRAAYGMAPLPASNVALTASAAALQGAGQTIYIVDAFHNPNTVSELNAFNTKFGLPPCVQKIIPTSAALPLAPATTADGCTISIVYSTTAGKMTATAPAYSSGWATEISLDVQWAHATAPRARIILIEAPDASIVSLTAAIKLANSMGPGVVSMSFGAKEGAWSAQYDSTFAAQGMNYFAATGDWGTGVYWPSSAANVLAVGGTTLTYSGTGARAETAWSGTGGGMSDFSATPAYQINTVPGIATPQRKLVADVAFNADPYSGQYVAIQPPGSGIVSWISAGGTSMSTPQWAAIMAIANAQRALSNTPRIATQHAILYNNIAADPTKYAAAFKDITSGSNGTCGICSSKIGYDTPTGLGTPNVGALLGYLAAAPNAPSPSISSGSVSGSAFVPITFNVTSNATRPVFVLDGAPTGMTISATGLVTWPVPSAGNRVVGVTVNDTSTGTSARGVYSLTVSPAVAPVISSSQLAGSTTRAFSGQITFADPNGLQFTFTLSGAPSGLNYSRSGNSYVLSWPRPLKGNYILKATATNAAGLTTAVNLPLTIS